MARLRLRALRRLAAALALVAAGPAVACGLHDPEDARLKRGMLNWTYPDSLHVWGLVGQHVASGALPAPPAAMRDPRIALMRAAHLLRGLGADLDARRGATDPPLSILLVGPLLWSVHGADPVTRGMAVHVDGPAEDGAIIVTDAPVLEALRAGRLSAVDAEAAGLLRFYGPEVATIGASAKLRDIHP